MKKKNKEILATIAAILVVDIFFTFEFLFIYIAMKIGSHHPVGFFIMMLMDFLFIMWVVTEIFVKN